MQIDTRIKSAFITFIALAIKFSFPLFLSYFANEKDFSFLLISYNTLLITGFVFSLEHHTYYHRRAIQKKKISKINLFEKKYFDQTLLIKLIIALFALFLLNQLFLIQKLIVFFIIYLDLHIVENIRKSVVKGEFFKSSLINGARLSFPIILFMIVFLIKKDIFLNYILLTTLLSFVIIKFIFKIRICNLKNLRLRKNIFLKLTFKTGQYSLISIIGILLPLLDKFILLNFEEYKMIQTMTLWAIFGNLISLFIHEYINKPYQPETMNYLKKSNFIKIYRNLISYQFLLLILGSISIILFRYQFESILNPVDNFNLLQILACIIVPASIPLNTFLNMSMYGYNKDTVILKFVGFEFFIKYIVTIITIVYYKPNILPFTLALSTLIVLFIKSNYLKNNIIRD